MNDQHPHAGYAAHDGQSNGSFDSDPLFGALPGTSPVGTVTYEADHSGQFESAQWSAGGAGYDPYAPGAPQVPYPAYEAYDAYPGEAQQPQQSYDASGQWDANGWNEADQAASYGYDATAPTTPPDQWAAAPVADSGTYDATAWNAGGQAAQPDVPFQAGPPYYGDGAAYDSYEAPAFDPTAFDPAAAVDPTAFDPHAFDPAVPEPAAYEPEADLRHDNAYEQSSHDQSSYDQPDYAQPDYTQGAPYASEHEYDTPGPEPEQVSESEFDLDPDNSAYAYSDRSGHSGHSDEDQLLASAATVTAATIAPRPVRRAAGGNRSRRRSTPAKRSALLTVAVPSACVMGVAGIAAASVGDLGAAEEAKDETTTLTAADATAIKPVAVNNKLDTQLAALDADARDFGDRASRTQERIDLKERQAAEKKKREELAAAARPPAQVRAPRRDARPQRLLRPGRRQLDVHAHRHRLPRLVRHTGHGGDRRHRPYPVEQRLRQHGDRDRRRRHGDLVLPPQQYEDPLRPGQGR